MKKTLRVLGIIAVAAMIGLGFVGCEDGSSTGGGGCGCVWGSWEETQAATYVSEGVETRTKVCEDCEDTETRAIARRTVPMVRINAGSFQRGQAGIATPVHEVTLTQGFFMGIHEVTQLQWRQVMTGNTNGISPNPSHFTGYRLPTEAQWEFSARASTDTLFSFGDTADCAYMWTSENSNNRTQEVGTRRANPWACMICMEMCGNGSGIGLEVILRKQRLIPQGRFPPPSV